MTINSSRDLRVAYETLSILDEILAAKGESAATRYKHHTDQIKRAIREYRDRPCLNENIVRNDYDSMLVVFPLPCELKTIEDADDYFMYHHYLEAAPSMYDCTGQVFTSWYKIFRRQGRFWAYHSTAMDV